MVDTENRGPASIFELFVIFIKQSFVLLLNLKIPRVEYLVRLQE